MSGSGGGGGGGGGVGGDDGNCPAESDDAAASVPLAAEVRLAGVENKEKMYEPKHNRKLVRVLTVVAYVFSVSLAAIMLSLYYVFLWKPPNAAQQQLLYNQYYNRALSHSPALTNAVPTPAVPVSKTRMVLPVSPPQTTWKNVMSRMNQFYGSSTTSSDDISDATEPLPSDLLDSEFGVSLRASQSPDQESTLSFSSEIGAAHSPSSLPSPPSPLPPPPSSASSSAVSAPDMLHQIVMGRRPIQEPASHHLRNTHYRGRDRNNIDAEKLSRFGSLLPLRGT